MTGQHFEETQQFQTLPQSETRQPLNPQPTGREKLEQVFERLARVGVSPEAVAMALTISLRKARREMAFAAIRIEARKPVAGCSSMTPLLERENGCRLPLDRLLIRAERLDQRILRTFDRTDSRSVSIRVRAPD